MKNIWIINHYGEPPTTGKYTRHYNFANNLIKKGYDTKIFTASTIHTTNINYIDNKNSHKEEIISGVPFVFIRSSNYEGNGRLRVRNMLEYSFRLLTVTKKYIDPDVIYASSPHPLTWLSAYVLSKRYKSKFIVETRDLWPETFVAMGKMKRNSIPAKILYKIEKFIYKKADKLIFTFPGGKDYVETIGVDNSKVRYINNGIDIEEFNYNKETNAYNDVDLDDENVFKVVFTGAIGKANGIDNLVKTALILKDTGYVNIKIYIFGDGSERGTLEKKIADHNLNNIRIKGRVEKRYIPNILSKTDLNIFSLEHLPSLFKYGISPNKMFDYFASGKPVLSNVECGYDMLEEYNCGKTVEGGSDQALADGIIKFYNMPKEEYNTYCSNALKAAEDFDFKILTDKLEQVILED